MTTTVTNPAAAVTVATGFGRWSVLLGAIVIQLILGTVYGYSIFWQPLQPVIFPRVLTQAQSTELVASGGAATGAIIVASDAEAALARERQQSNLKLAFAICVMTFAAVMVVAGRVQDIMGPRLPAIAGGALMAVGFLAASFLDSVQLGEWGKILLLWGTIGMLAGAGIGFAYVCPIAALVKWFPAQKGLVSGVAVAGFGLGALIFSRPELPFSARHYIDDHGIVSLFLIHGVVCLIAITLGAMLLRNPPGMPPKTAKAESNWQQTLRRPAFYVLWVMYFSGSLAGLMVIGIVAPFVVGQLGGGAEAVKIGAIAVGILSIFNALGRVFWGLVSDRIGRTPAFMANFLIQAVVMFFFSSLDTRMALYVGAGLVGFNYGGNFALFPSATADLFGAKNLGANYGWVFTSYGVAGVVGIYAGNIAKEQTGSYHGAFILAAVLCLVSAALALGLRVSQSRKVTA